MRFELSDLFTDFLGQWNTTLTKNNSHRSRVEHLIRIDKSRDIDKTFNRLQKNKLTLSISISRKRFPSHTVDATKRANSIV